MHLMFRTSVAMFALSLTAGAGAAKGTASGTLTANGKTVKVTLAQAFRSPDGWKVQISDVAVPDDFDAVEKGAVHILTLSIGSTGEIQGWHMAHQGLNGFFLGTGKADLKITKLGPARVEGTVKKASDTYGSNTVSFDVTFKAPVQVDVN